MECSATRGLPPFFSLKGPDDSDRESQRWAAAVEQIGPPPDGTRYTFMGDRESDIFETVRRCQDCRWDFIVRANQSRALVEVEGSVFERKSTRRRDDDSIHWVLLTRWACGTEQEAMREEIFWQSLALPDSGV